MKPRLVHLLTFCALAVGVRGRAWGQAAPVITGKDVQVGYQGLPARVPSNSETGVQVSDGVLLHAGIGAEAGYDSNVFYAQSNERASPIIRVLPFAELTNATRTGVIPSGMFFDLSANLTYREYLSSDAAIRQQRAFMPAVSATLDFGSSQALSLLVGNNYARTEDPPYVAPVGNPQPSQQITRDSNQAFAQLNWAPGGGRLAAALRYTNLIDFFENSNDPLLQQSSTISHDVMLDASWKWLPKTALFVTVHQGYITFFEPGRATSLPLRAVVGLRGLITNKLALNIALGYSNGFYSGGVAGPTGVRGNLQASAEATYRPTIETTAVLGYRHDFQNAILANFYYVDAVYVNISQAIAGRVGLGLSARYEHRSFSGVQDMSGAAVGSRNDNYLQAGANLDYHFQAWSYAGVSYALMKNDSDAQQQPGGLNAPIYTKQLIFARLGITY